LEEEQKTHVTIVAPIAGRKRAAAHQEPKKRVRGVGEVAVMGSVEAKGSPASFKLSLPSRPRMKKDREGKKNAPTVGVQSNTSRNEVTFTLNQKGHP